MDKLAFERPFIKRLSSGMPSKFGMKSKMEPILEIDKNPVKNLIANYGSPLFVISEKTVRNTFNEAKNAFSTRYPKVQFAWSYKTNYLDAVCRIYHDEGSWAEVVSGFEYEKAIKNGVPGNQIIFNGPDKSDEDLMTAIQNDSLIHIDHFDELYSLLSLSEKAKQKPKVAIRINMDTGIYPMWDRFGFNYDNGEAWDALNRIMRSDALELMGLHTHIGTFILSSDAYRKAAMKLSDLAIGLERKYGHVIKYIDMGGGFASKNTLKGAYHPGTDTAPTFDDYAEAITSALLNSQIKPENLPLLILETGRALIDDAGYLLGTVLANKRLADGRRSTIMDIGVNMLFTSFWYEHILVPAKEYSEHSEETAVYGPLCMNIDVIREAVDFPLLKKGDQVVIKRIGAYNMTQWMQFITMRPNVILIDTKNKSHIVRHKESVETIIAQESVPEHLK